MHRTNLWKSFDGNRLSGIKIPRAFGKMISKKECMGLLKKYEMPDNVLAHSIMVNKVAVFLAEKLAEKDVEIYIPLVDTASLLHDIGKIKEIKGEEESHVSAGYEILQKENLISQAIICRKHGSLSPLNPITKPKTWEEKVVFYADKRVLHDRIVSIQERLEDANKRYPKHAKEERKAFLFVEEVEKEIFDRIGIKPEDLKKYIK